MAKNSFLPDRLLSITICFCVLSAGRTLAQPPSATLGTDSLRQALSHIYQSELGVQEASGHNDGARVASYLRYTHNTPGQEWCAAFVCWCFATLGRAQPRNAWSPALFPKTRIVGPKSTVQQGDVFGLWVSSKNRIGHVGFIDSREGECWLTVEGNVHNAVRRMRRHWRTVYAVSNWMGALR